MRISIKTLLITLSAWALLITNNQVALSAKLPKFQPAVRAPLSDETIYFVMTDRFENALPDDPVLTGYRYDDIGYWHGGDFRGLTNRLDYIKELGFTAIWITPPVVNAAIQGDSAGYHGYWGLDFTSIDPHLGSEADFRSFVKEAHDRGLKVILDMVVNHTADVIKPADGRYSFRGLSEKPFTPVIPAGMEKSKVPEWLNNLDNYNNRGNFGNDSDSIWFGDFFGLDDLATDRPEVLDGWIRVWSDWIEKYGIDGYRIDTAKHVLPGFWKKFLPAIEEKAKKLGKRDFLIFGEVADSESSYLATYLAENKFDSVLDFSFQDRAIKFVRFTNQSQGMIDLFNDDDLYTTKDNNAYSLTTFLGNHDMGRTGMFLERASFGDRDLAFARAKLANELLFLYRGAPVLYYGDEKGMIGSGGDKSARQNMFPTRVLEWQVEPRLGSDPIGRASSFDVTHPLESQVTELNQLIQKNIGLRIGALQLKAASRSSIAFTRSHAGREFLILMNSGEAEEEIKVEFTANRSMRQIYGPEIALPNSFQTLKVAMPPLRTVILETTSSLSASRDLSVTLLPIDIDYGARRWLLLAARVPGDESVEVNFQIRVNGKKGWKNVGTSDRRTFKSENVAGGLHRIYLRPDEFPNGTRIEAIAIVRNAEGRLAYSKIRSYRI